MKKQKPSLMEGLLETIDVMMQNADKIGPLFERQRKLEKAASLTLRQAEDLVRVAFTGGPKYATRSVAMALHKKGLLFKLRGSKPEVVCYTTDEGGHVAFLVLVALLMVERTSSEGFRETCFFCKSLWGKCTCPSASGKSADGPGFDFDDTCIVDPCLDTSGRFFVDPFVYYGDAYRAFAKEHPR